MIVCFQVSVRFEVTANTALYGLDYSMSSHDIILAGGETEKRVPIEIIDDILPEEDENFSIKLLEDIAGSVYQHHILC